MELFGSRIAILPFSSIQPKVRPIPYLHIHHYQAPFRSLVPSFMLQLLKQHLRTSVVSSKALPAACGERGSCPCLNSFDVGVPNVPVVNPRVADIAGPAWLSIRLLGAAGSVATAEKRGCAAPGSLRVI